MARSRSTAFDDSHFMKKHGFCPMAVMHRWTGSKSDPFIYKTFNLLLDVFYLDEVNTPVLKINRPGLMSIQEKKYGKKDNLPLPIWITEIVQQHQISCDAVYLMTRPKIFGCEFNPFTFLFFVKNNQLASILVNIIDDFKKNHQYLICPDESGVISAFQYYKASETFQTPSFLSDFEYYTFRFVFPSADIPYGGKIGVWIDYYDQDKKVLETSITGKITELTTKRLLIALVKYPLMTLIVLFRIRYQVFKLWLKKTLFYFKSKMPKGKRIR